MQPKKKQKAPTQRSMTFSGCFTCRSRGVKCDEQRPCCQRCVKAGRACAGYGVRLVWAEQESQPTQKPQKSKKSPASGLRSQRRSLPWAYGRDDGGPEEAPALGDDELDALIAALPEEDAAQAADDMVDAKTHQHPHAHLFGFFAAAPRQPPSPPPQQRALTLAYRAGSGCISSPVLQACLDDLDNALDPARLNSIHCLDDIDILDAIFSIALDPLMAPAAHTGPHATRHIASPPFAHTPPLPPTARLCPSPQPSKESQLLDYWVTHTSNIMVAIPLSDNPFRSIYIPMALAALGQLVPSAEHTALLHSIFAMAAFNHAQKQPVSSCGTYNRLGVEHHQLSITHLHRSFSAGHHNQDPEVVLATIILLVSTNCVTHSSTSWRTHLRLGRQWLVSTAQAKWHTGQTASTLYQIFLMLEALGTSTSTSASASTAMLSLPAPLSGVGRSDTSADGHNASDYTYNSIFGLSCPALSYYYRLDSLFGIAQPIFEAIVHINRLRARGGPASPQEVDNLRAKIMLNDPRSLRPDILALAGETERRFIHHHAYVYYFACRIHYERTLFHAAPHTVQHLVRNALNHLDAIAQLGTDLDVVGLTWPVIVVACEADDPSLQQRVAWFFAQGQKYGVWGISSAYQVLSEVWRRRISQPKDDHANVSWQNVMTELGLDLLLA